jgi:hypothetical protein
VRSIKRFFPIALAALAFFVGSAQPVGMFDGGLRPDGLGEDAGTVSTPRAGAEGSYRAAGMFDG